VAKVFALAGILGQVILLWRLRRFGIGRAYRAFSIYLLTHTVEAALLFPLDPSTNLYGYIFFLFVPLRCLVAFLAIQELYGLVLARYSGIETLSRRVIQAGLLVAFLLSGISLYPEMSSGGGRFPILLAFHAFERAFSTALLLFMFCLTVFVLWFPVPLTRNTVLHTIVFAVSFGANSILFLIRGVLGEEPLMLLSALYVAIHCACLVAWILFLVPGGETAPSLLGHRWSAEERHRLVGQLDAINHSLARLARKE
jgi:hypothetical protein